MLSDVRQKQVVRSSLIRAHPRSDIPFMHHCKRSWGSFSPPPTPLSNASLLSRIAYLFPFFLARSCTTVADEGGSLRLAADVTSMLIRWNSRLGGVRAYMYGEDTPSVPLLSVAPGPFPDLTQFLIRPDVSPPPRSSPSPSPLLEKLPHPAADWLRR